MTLYLRVMRDDVCSAWDSNNRHSASMGMTSCYMCLVWGQSACHRATAAHGFCHRADTPGALLPSVASAQVGMYLEKRKKGCEKIDLPSALCCVTKKEESESGWPGNDGDPSENGTK